MFALLEDASSPACSPTVRRSRLYTEHVRTLSCDDCEALPALMDEMQQALQGGLFALGLFSYEMGVAMQGLRGIVEKSPWPVTEVLLFRRCEHLSTEDVAHWLDEQSQQQTQQPAGVADVRFEVDDAAFESAIKQIHAYLASGDCYQINYTTRVHCDAFGHPIALYQRLRARQPVPYGALIFLPEDRSVLSFSPELFVRFSEGALTAQPMKGTAAASEDEQDNVRRAKALAGDPKNRAENLMIVDLLRNDLGKVAVPGSVHVTSLFDVQQFKKVLQMTSTICARPRDEVRLFDVMAALFPCGSITGAPKKRAMEIIDELETSPRGLYTGCIGWFDPPSAGESVAPVKTMGDFCLSVAIRTLLLRATSSAMWRGEMGVGAGIVYDSVATDELEECRLKAQFLTGCRPEFSLFETMFATSSGCRYLEQHLQRLGNSAHYFGFVWDEAAITQSLMHPIGMLKGGASYRVRLTLHADGQCDVHSTPLCLTTDVTAPVSVLISDEATNPDDVFLRHKTTVRKRYDDALRVAESVGAFDMLFFNTRGELTEGARSNVFVKLSGRWITPPLSCGLLPGIMRGVLLQDPAWAVTERCLRREDLAAAEEVVVCNALRGVRVAIVRGNF